MCVCVGECVCICARARVCVCARARVGACVEVVTEGISIFKNIFRFIPEKEILHKTAQTVVME